MANFVGTPGNDNITGTTGNDVFDLTQGGDDTVYGGSGADTFNFGSALTAADYVEGGTTGGPWTISLDGNYSAGVVVNAKRIDSISLGTDHSYDLTLGTGFTVSSYSQSFYISAANLTAGNTLAFDGTALAAAYQVGITGSAGNDTLLMGKTTALVSIAGGAGDDYIQGDFSLQGQAGNDTLIDGGGIADGGEGNDLLIATGSAYLPTELIGGVGNDTLIVDGATSAILIGDAGQDSFVFRSIPLGLNGITIDDLEAGETIDLSALVRLTFIGTQSFSGIAGQVKYLWDEYGYPGHTIVQIDTDGDGLPDGFITLSGEQTLKETATGSNILKVVPDIAPPSLISTSPTDNDTLVSIQPGIRLTFDEFVQLGVGNIEVHTADGALFETVDVKDAVNFNFPARDIWFSVGPLSPSTSYYVTVTPGALKDLAGNDFAGISSPNSLNFTTAAQAPTGPPPAVVTKSLTNGYQIDKDFVVSFSGPISAGTGDINLYENGVLLESMPVTDRSRVTIAGNTVIVNPTHSLAYGFGYTLDSTYYVLRDYAGQRVDFSGYLFSSEAGPGSGGARPLLVTTSPADDTANVAINAALVLSFDQPVTFGAGQFEFRRADGALVQAIGVADATQVSYSGNSVTVHPMIGLAPGVTYSVTFASGAIRDLEGNSFEGITSASAFTFTTTGVADTTAPILVSTAPGDNATNVSVGADITLTFSESIQPGAGDIEIHKSDGSLFKSIAIADHSQVTFSGHTVTIDPTIDLSIASDYYVILPSGAIMDYAGNAYAGISSTAAFNFSAPHPADTAPPILRSSTPLDSQTDVLVSADIVFVFNELMAPGSGHIGIHRSSDGVAIATIDINDTSQVTLDQNTVTIDPSHDLGFATGYYVTLDPGSVTDLSGNPYAGLSWLTAFDFTTVAPPDVTPPVLISTPLDNATGVALSPHIALKFNEPVKAGTGNFILHNAADGSTVDSIAAADAVISGNSVTIGSFQLHPGTSYYLTIVPGVITDTVGNSFAGLSSKFDLNFTTAPTPDTSPPQLVWSAPSDNKIGVATDANITLTFNEAVKAGTGNIVLHKASDDSTTSFAIGDTSQVSVIGNSIAIKPHTDLSPDDHYYLTIGPGVILDSADNAFAGIDARTTLDFRTTGPSLSGLHFNIIYDQNVSSLPTGFVSDLLSATQFFADRYSDPVTINLHVGYGELKGDPLDAGALAESTTDFERYTYSQIRSAITGDASSNDDLRAFLSLPEDDPTNGGTFLVTSAEAAALGLPNASTAIGGYIGFSSTAQFDYDPSDGVTSGTYDFFGAAAHEVSEVMGRELAAGFQGNYFPLDLFDYWATGQRALDSEQTGSFSLDSGYTKLVRFNSNSFGDAGDWDVTAGNDSFDAFANPGAVNPVSQNDSIVMDALGYDPTAANDMIPLLLLSTSPSDHEFQVPVDANVVLMFNQVVEAGSGDIVIHSAADGTVVESIPVTDTSRTDFSGSVVTIDPSVDLSERSGYYVTVSTGAITDAAGTAYSGITSTTALNFGTRDTFPNIAGPEVTVIGAGHEIVSGDTTPRETDLTDFLSISQGNHPTPHIFTVRNNGGSTLTLGTLKLPAGFSLVDAFASSLDPGASDTFSVQLDTSSPGTKSGQITFATNDSNESPFGFWITGTVSSSVIPNVNHLPVVTAVDAKIIPGTTVSVNSLFNVSDSDNDSIAMYRVVDSTTGNGFFVVNGVARTDAQLLIVTPEELGSSAFHANGSDILQFSAFDGIAWGDPKTINVSVDRPPVVIATDLTAAPGTTVAADTLVYVSDADSDPIAMYRVLDNTPGNGFFVVNGAARASGQTLILTPSELASSTFHVSGSDNLQVSAFDGIAWSDPKSFNISADNAPVVAAQDVIVNPGQTVGVSSLFSVGDADNDPITMYRLLDNTPGNGFFVVNGAARASGQMLTLTPSELASSTFHAGGSDNLQISAFDGMAWSDPKSFNVSGDHLPIIAASDVKVPVGQTVAVSSLFSVSDVDNDPITMYRVLDNTPGNGFFVVNGAARSDGQTLLLTPSELASSTFHASGSDNLQISAFDGIAWSDPKSFNISADHPPVVAAQDVIVNPGQTVGVSSLFSVSDADNDPITMYRLLDDTPGNGFFVVNGAARPDGQTLLLTPSELAGSTFHTSGSADSVEISAFDGIVWSDPATIHVDVLI